MNKKYAFFNEEPNVNILGLDPIIEGFVSDEMKNFAGRNLPVFIFELNKGTFQAGAAMEDWTELSKFSFEKIEKDPDFEGIMVSNIEKYADEIFKLCKNTLKRLQEGEISDEEKKNTVKKIFSLLRSICAYGFIGPTIGGCL